MNPEMIEYLDSLSPMSMEEAYEFEEYWRKNEAFRYLWWLKIEDHKARSPGEGNSKSRGDSVKCPSCGTIDLIKIKYRDDEGVIKGIKIRCPNCSRFTPILPPESTIEDGFKIIKEADRW